MRSVGAEFVRSLEWNSADLRETGRQVLHASEAPPKMRNPLTVARAALETSGLKDRLRVTGGEMVEGMWAIGINPVAGTPALGGLTKITWRVSDQTKHGDLPMCPLVWVVEDYRFAATTSEETAQLNEFLDTIRAELARPDDAVAGEPAAKKNEEEHSYLLQIIATAREARGQQ